MRHLPELDALADGWSAKTLQPLRITMELSTPLGGFGPIHLDALLSSALAQRATRGRGVAPSADPYWLPLPLAQLWADPAGLPLWAATDFAPEGETKEDAQTWHRYGVPARMVARSRQGALYAPRMTQGPEKLMAVPVPLVVAERWAAWCVGDAEIVADLLSDLTHVGKKRAQGLGAVARWGVEPAPAFSLLDDAGRLRRPVPLACLEAHGWQMDVRVGWQLLGWTPPYWPGVRGTQALCLPAGAEIAPEYLP